MAILMKTIFTIIGIIVFFYLVLLISNYCERKRQEKLIKKLGPKLDNLLTRVEAIETVVLVKEINHIKQRFFKTLAKLKEENGEYINICPKCGDTLAVKDTAYYGKIFGCPNYPNCRYLVKVADKNANTFDLITVD
ncbi:MAG: topoisomerase DNA-binding C4 zinc finger domain-containing protein [Candidatus Schekmanbacteria bacterium]|nr:topoisomerase DNA-binding C4 zinc finger domain-containing protein [Candidatus Schekmanbacteria bacterium]